MMTKQSNNQAKPRLVTCGACRHFRRDTEGPSFDAYTHEYFMGVCGLGLKPDSPIKQFADRKRVCGRFVG